MKKKILFITSLIIILISLIYTVFAININELNSITNKNKLENIGATKVEYKHKGSDLNDEGLENLLSNLNSGNAFTLLNTEKSLFCIKQGYPLRVGSTVNGLIMDSYCSLTWNSYNEYASYEIGSQIPRSGYVHIEPDSDIRGNSLYKYSNTKFLASPLTDLNTVVHPFDGNTYDFAYVATFSEKASTNYNGNHGDEITQKAIWAYTGDDADNYKIDGIYDWCYDNGINKNLYKASIAYKTYENWKKNHGTEVSVKPYEKEGETHSEAGAVLVGNSYQIGPFTMSDYTYAYSAWVKPFSGKELQLNKGLIGGILSGEVVLKDDNGVEKELDINGTTVKIVYEGFNTTPENKKIGRNTDSGTYATVPPNYIYPWPESTFYIEIDKSLCRDSETLTDINFTYRITETDGEGWIINSKTIEHKWDFSEYIKDCCTYNCNVCNWSGKNKNEHSNCDTTSYCEHGYPVCERVTAYNYTNKIEYAQPMLAVKNANTIVRLTDSTYGSDDGDYSVRITTNVTIDKYIVKVEHQNKYSDDFPQVTFNGEEKMNHYIKEDGVIVREIGTDFKRDKKAVLNKYRDPIVVEKGDKVTYYIDLVNHQNNDSSYYIKDYLPVNSKDAKITSLLQYTELSGAKEPKEWVYVFSTGKEGGEQEKIIDGKRGYKEDGHLSATTVRRRFIVELIVDDVDLTTNDNNINICKYIYGNAGPVDPTGIAGPKDYVRDGQIRKEEDYDRVYNGPVVNIAEFNPSATSKREDKDYFIINNYEAILDNYIVSTDAAALKENKTYNFEDLYKYNTDLSKEGDSIITQERATEAESTELSIHNRDIEDESLRDAIKQKREAYSVPIEKGEKVTFNIKVKNDFTTRKSEVDKDNVRTLHRDPTLVRTSEIINNLESGLELRNLSAKIYDSNGNEKLSITRGAGLNYSIVTNTIEGKTFNKYTYYLDDVISNKFTLIEPGGYIIYTVEAEVTKSNMYLYNLESKAEIGKLTNINSTSNYDINLNIFDGIIKKDELIQIPKREVEVTDLNVVKDNQKHSSDYVRLKDLIIAGKVWLDYDKNGEMIEYSRLEHLANGENSHVFEDRFMKDIVVKLYSVEDGKSTLERTTVTDKNGLYTFAREDNSSTEYRLGLNQRIDKATNKDATGLYTTNSEYKKYYIEYEYDGVLYKSTEIYAGNTNLDSNGDIINVDGVEKYKIDSNAQENRTIRDEFNKKYQTISHNVAYAMDEDGTTGEKGSAETPLTFEKEEHNSYLYVDHSRTMTARSFLEDDGTTKYLWLYNYGDTNDDKVPETEYLKYINLGLEEREDIDISLTKDVYEVKTTVNGEEMTYSFEQLQDEGPQALNGEIGTTKKYLQDYIVKEPYGLTLYEADFKYRYEQYKNATVRAAKGEESELNVEVTYKITVDSKAIANDEPYKDDKDRELDVTVHEIVDIYDENFIKYKDNPNETINIKGKDADNVLQNKSVKIAEAWYHENNDITADKKYLTLSNTSEYTDKQNDFASDGYNTLYIRGMESVKVGEGEKLDIYVKYVIDKIDTEDLQRVLKLAEETLGKNSKRGLEGIAQVNAYSVWYEESGRPASIVDCDSNVGNVGIRNSGDNISVDFHQYYEDTAYKTGIVIDVENYSPEYMIDIYGNVVNIEDVSDVQVEIDKFLKSLGYIKCSQHNPGLKIAQLIDDNRYGYHPSGECCYDCKYGGSWVLNLLVRRDLAELNKEYTLEEVLELSNKYMKILKGEISDNQLIRTITGKVWDDSRSEEEDKQYHGNGQYANSDEKLGNAKLNENVSENYKDDSITEQKDILVRNVKAEYVEIVPVRVSENEIRYFEEKLTGPWASIQNTRTQEDGTYTLNGFIPGYYTLRYTYGDESTNTDMLIFNGQDYKSTTYTGVEDSVTDDDEIMKIMESENRSDARDDEIRRLESMAYSETMVSKKAEVLKGTANGTILSEETVTNSAEQYQELTDNTYMEADTVKFYAKPEKLEKLTNNPEKSVLKNSVYSYLLKSNDNSKEIIYSNLFDLIYEDTKVSERLYKIKNLDFGIEYRPETQITLSKAISGITLTTSDGKELVKLVLDTENFGQGNQQQNVIKEGSEGLEYTQFISNDYKTINPYDLTSEDYQGFVFINVDDEILQGSTIEIEYSFVAQNNSEVDRISQNLDAIRFEENEKAQENTDKIQYVRVDGDGTLYDSIGDDSNKYIYTASGTASKILYDEFYGIANGEEYRKADKTGYTEYYGRYLGKTYYTGEKADTDVVASVKFDKILDYVDTDLVFKTSKEADSMWSITTDKELLGDDATRGLFVKKELFTSDGRLVNSKGINYMTYSEDGLTPITSNLVISVDDRVRDVDEYASESDDKTINKGISKYLQPAISGMNNSKGTIKISATKVISAETDTEDMQYENLAEVIQYTSQTGRRTNYATTIGNASATIGEFASATKELDTSATEVITLTPPTGLDRLNRTVRDTVEVAGTGIGIFVIAIALVFGGTIITKNIIKKIKKRPIK